MLADLEKFVLVALIVLVGCDGDVDDKGELENSTTNPGETVTSSSSVSFSSENDASLSAVSSTESSESDSETTTTSHMTDENGNVICNGDRYALSDEEFAAFVAEGCVHLYGDLYISNLRISSVQQLEKLHSVISLSFSSFEVTSLDGLQNLEQVSALQIAGNPKLESIQALSKLTKVTSLVVSSNPLLRSLSGLENIKSCSRLIMEGNGIESLEPLRSWPPDALITYMIISDNSSLPQCDVEQFDTEQTRIDCLDCDDNLGDCAISVGLP